MLTGKGFIKRNCSSWRLEEGMGRPAYPSFLSLPIFLILDIHLLISNEMIISWFRYCSYLFMANYGNIEQCNIILKAYAKLKPYKKFYERFKETLWEIKTFIVERPLVVKFLRRWILRHTLGPDVLIPYMKHWIFMQNF